MRAESAQPAGDRFRLLAAANAGERYGDTSITPLTDPGRLLRRERDHELGDERRERYGDTGRDRGGIHQRPKRTTASVQRNHAATVCARVGAPTTG